jgi:uncharacterized protein (DUF433 family)
MTLPITNMPDGSYRVTGSRVTLDSLIHSYWNGESNETMVVSFPTLTLQQVELALAYYLQHREELDAYMKEQEKRWSEFEQESKVRNRDLIERINTSVASSK